MPRKVFIQQNGEFITADAVREEIHFTKPVSNLIQNIVARFDPVKIIDLFKVVDIKYDTNRRVSLTHIGNDFLAIRQSGQLIVVGQFQ